jgi:hypothetical protein
MFYLYGLFLRKVSDRLFHVSSKGFMLLFGAGYKSTNQKYITKQKESFRVYHRRDLD